MVMGLPAELILRGTAAAMVRAAAHCTINPSSLRTVLAAGGNQWVTSCRVTCAMVGASLRARPLLACRKEVYAVGGGKTELAKMATSDAPITIKKYAIGVCMMHPAGPIRPLKPLPQ